MARSNASFKSRALILAPVQNPLKSQEMGSLFELPTLNAGTIYLLYQFNERTISCSLSWFEKRSEESETVSLETINASKARSILGKPGLLPLLSLHLSIFFPAEIMRLVILEQRFNTLMITGAIPRILALQMRYGEWVRGSRRGLR